jgi:pilus assembly protein CpaC
MWVGRKLWVGLVGLVAGGLLCTAAGPAAVLGAALQEAGGQRLRVLVGKSLVVNSPDALRRVSVTDPEVAEAIVISERQVLIHGHRTGSVTLLLWNEEEEVQAFDLEVQLDVPTLREALRRVLPKDTVEVRQSGTALVLTGEVGSETSVQRAEALASTFSPQVVNMLAIRESHEIILLQVRFAEVNRAALSELGMNLISTGATGTIGAISTQQFGGLTSRSGRLGEGARQPTGTSAVGGSIGESLSGSPAAFGMNDLLNVFLFRPDLNLAVTIRALEQRSLLQILAEPNVLALDGREASFLAGGEFPFPVVQAGALSSVTIQFREFGVRLGFTPQVLDEGLIRLKVAPEVSALDFANALTISGFVVPAISTRKAETEVELRHGQSFAIAGLIDNRLLEIASKVPFLGDIPFLGKLFRSRSLDRSNSELMVIVTPQLVSALDPSEVPDIEMPQEFMDTGRFDGRGSGSEAPGGR